MFLLDTNVVSEPTKTRPNAAVLDWMAAQRTSDNYLSVLTIGEVARGVSRLPAGNRRLRLGAWLQILVAHDFAKRILPITTEIAVAWGLMRAPRTRPDVDLLIAATAQVHNLAVVTRNERHFSDLGLHVINPWRP